MFRNSGRPDNIYIVKDDAPGPGEYSLSHSVDSTFKQKLWSSNLEAFGSIQQRFPDPKSQNQPGPTAYRTQQNWLTNSKIVTTRNKSTNRKHIFKTQSIDANFRSMTERHHDLDLRQHLKSCGPPPGTYEEKRNLAHRAFDGGSPNNFARPQGSPKRVGFSSTTSRNMELGSKESKLLTRGLKSL
jgi:hypothetical protein